MNNLFQITVGLLGIGGCRSHRRHTIFLSAFLILLPSLPSHIQGHSSTPGLRGADSWQDAREPPGLRGKTLDSAPEEMGALKTIAQEFILREDGLPSVETIRSTRDVEDVRLEEPLNDLELETTRLSNDFILEKASKIARYDYYKSTSAGGENEVLSIEPTKVEDLVPGEGRRASSRARSLPLTKPDTAASITEEITNATANAARSEDRKKTNSDIQDIITGFVKLLNGNQNGNGFKPTRTRINNRGPPRISDVPPLILDPVPPPPPITMSTITPAKSTEIHREPQPMPPPTRIPSPYPYDVPLPPQPANVKPFLSGFPLPEQIVPFNTTKAEKPSPSPVTLNVSVTSEVNVVVSNNSISIASNVTDANVKNVTLDINPSAVKQAPTVSVPLPMKFVDNSTSTGVGSAVVVLEPSTQEPSTSPDLHTSTTPNVPASSLKKRPQFDGNTYFPRPGIVLDDPEYKPGLRRRPGPSIITAAPPVGKDTFELTVSAVQGPGSEGKTAVPGQSFVSPVDVEEGHAANGGEVITTAPSGQNFMSIEGKRTYLNLFDSSTVTNTGSVVPTSVKNYASNSIPNNHATSQSPPKTTSNPTKSPPAWRKPTHPPVRIDTCIVGDDSTCDAAQHERCKTETGVSSCHCRPGYTRRKHRDPCHRVVSLLMSLRVDKMYEQRLSWNDKYGDNDTAEYQQLEYESAKAMDSALSMTPFSDLFMGSKVNNIYTLKNSNKEAPVFMNMTVQLLENQDTLRNTVKQELQKHLMGVLHRRSNNIGSSPLWVDAPAGAISQIHDMDECANPELNDCNRVAKCMNVFGSFHCTCPEGYRDPWNGNSHRSGRTCETCDASQCNHRGECTFQNGQPACKCIGSYYGAQCEIDGEVLGVAIGSSVIALLIISTTLVCLCAWSRRWNREQKIGSPIFGYMPSGGSTVKTPAMGAPPYQISVEDRVRWAQIADAMAHANHYGPEPIGMSIGGGRTSSIFGYSMPPQGPMMMPRVRAPSVHTLRTPESSTSEEEDRADLLGRHFQVPRPKSRSSVANQSGIYYDVDYEHQSGEIFSTMKSGQPAVIPLNTYTMGSRSHYYR